MATSSAGTQVIMNLSSSYGPMLLGCLFSAALWGISSLQLFLYFLNCDNDSILLKVFVMVVWLFDTASQMLTFASLWPVLIVKWGSLEELGLLQLTAIHRVWVVSVVTCCVQLFYLWRIYRFTHKRRLLFPLILAPFVFWQLVEPVLFLVWLLKDLSFATLLARRTVALELSLRASNIFVDTAIMVAMVYLLLQQRHSEFRRSRKLIGRLVVMTVNTGLITTVVAILDLILVLVFPSGIQYCVFEYPLGSLYVNALLANLNCRDVIKHTGTQLDTFVARTTREGPLFSISKMFNNSEQSATVTAMNQQKSNQSIPMNIRVGTETETSTDYLDISKPIGGSDNGALGEPV